MSNYPDGLTQAGFDAAHRDLAGEPPCECGYDVCERHPQQHTHICRCGIVFTCPTPHSCTEQRYGTCAVCRDAYTDDDGVEEDSLGKETDAD